MKDITPPKRILNFFRWFCHPDYVDDIEGDLTERFYRNIEDSSTQKAKRIFAIEVIKLLRPEIIKPMGGTYRLNNFGLLKNYLNISWRSLKQQKLYAGINIGGLALGLACFIMIYLYVSHEQSYDKFYPNLENTYRIFQRQEGNHSLGTDLYAVTPGALPPTLIAEYPEVEYATSVLDMNVLFTVENEHYMEPALGGDPHFFDVLRLEFISGNRKTALDQPSGLVLTESFANKIFNSKDVLGKEVEFWGKTATVTGVIKDPPANSSIKYSAIFSILRSNYYQQEVKKTKWNGNEYNTFVTLKPGHSAKDLEAKMPALLQKHWAHTDIKVEYIFQRIDEMHLGQNINEDIAVKGNRDQLTLFSIVAILVIILACFNYMNLAIARSTNRNKEVGVRKVIGAKKSQLIFQFLMESILMTTLSLFVAVGLVYLILPYFSHLIERELEISTLFELSLFPWLLLLVLVIGVFSGLYPSVVISSQKAVGAFKNNLINQPKSLNLQKWLIVGQYAISITMIISSILIYRQFQFIKERPLGYDKDMLLTINLRGKNVFENMDILKNEWQSRPSILAMSNSSNPPTYIQSSTFLTLDRKGLIYRLYTDSDFINLFNIELVAGRYFEPDRNNKETDRVLNETAARALGWSPSEAVGKTFVNEGGDTKTVIGVVKDFHMHSMHLPIAPLMIGYRENEWKLSLKISSENINETIIYLEESYSKFSPYPFNYSFIDDQFERLYKVDRQQADIINFFTILAVIIASIGLFGLSAFLIQQRTKEIGIRKVLGASVSQITTLLTTGFVKLVFIGFLISIPVSWLITSNWLDRFAYRISIEWGVFVIVGFLSALLAVLTVGAKSINAALTNPVNCLRDE